MDDVPVVDGADEGEQHNSPEELRLLSVRVAPFGKETPPHFLYRRSRGLNGPRRPRLGPHANYEHLVDSQR